MRDLLDEPYVHVERVEHDVLTTEDGTRIVLETWRCHGDGTLIERGRGAYVTLIACAASGCELDGWFHVARGEAFGRLVHARVLVALGRRTVNRQQLDRLLSAPGSSPADS